MRGAPVVRKHSGKVVLPTNVKGGLTPKTVLKWADTEYYQVDLSGDYVQSGGGV